MRYNFHLPPKDYLLKSADIRTPGEKYGNRSERRPDRK
jgi:hypothetical protein